MGKISLVPTMGCLHEGHLALVQMAKEFSQKCIVSIFVNPLQFGPNEDYSKYPRTLEADLDKLSAIGVDAVFTPPVEAFYPPGFATRVTVSGLPDSLCGKSRPGHFAGVATVCLKLFESTQADVAVFGEKDFQQLAIMKQLTRDLNLPIKILPHPIIREKDGVAMSSRNRYLSQQERQWARQIPQSLSEAQELAWVSEKITAGEMKHRVQATLTAAPLVIDYIEVASSLDLIPVIDTVPLMKIRDPRLFVAVKAGATRLIDNTELRGNR